MEKVMVTGAKGMVGRNFREMVEESENQTMEYHFHDRQQCDLLDF